jgi:hypothetical protein
MDQPYSLWADGLSKFQGSSEPIQALWLVAVPVTVLGALWLVLRGLRDLIPTLSRREWRGHLIYGVYQDADGRWMIYWHGRAPQAVDWENPPPELVGRGHVIRRPEA